MYIYFYTRQPFSPLIHFIGMIKSFFTLAICTLFFSSCSTNPITGKSQAGGLVSEGDMQSMALTQYASFLQQNKVISNGKDADMVRRVGSRLSLAIAKYYTDQGKPNVTAGYKWEYNLVDSKEANAWCMPGGKIVVYTGLLPLSQNENGLAIVLGHEITHALAQHGRVRMSEQLLQQLGGVALSTALSSKPAETQNMFNQAYGIGSTLGTLSHSRTQELEADKFGLTYAALAGYDPREAIVFWERMKVAANGTKPPEFLSTHPSDDNRIAQIKELMPEALSHYTGATNNKK